MRGDRYSLLLAVVLAAVGVAGACGGSGTDVANPPGVGVNGSGATAGSSGTGNITVMPDTMEVDLDGEMIKADVCNVIPGQMAGRIAGIAGVTEGNWAPVLPDDMQSKIDENVYVLGDASNQGDMPKSGFSANSQAKVAAMAI